MLLASAGLPANAQWPDPEWAERAREAFFHVTVTGTPLDPSASAEARQGKAFAIGPTLLITSQHLVGDASEWGPESGLAKEIARATRPLARSVKLVRAVGGEDDDAFADPIVMPAPAYVLDAAGISLPNATIEKHFRLSMCDIVEAEHYTAIMTEADDPADPGSVKKPVPVELEAAGYKPAQYGGLYLFEPVGNPPFQGDSDGHDGSPILDAEGDVVAVVSAVTAAEGGGHLILATPIQPMFPGANALLARAPDAGGAEQSLKCSLSDTVRRIDDQVAALAIWSLRVDRDADGRPSDELGLRYESLGDAPNIRSVRIEYDFFGKQRQMAPITRLQYPDEEANDTEVVDDAPGEDRELATAQVVREGKEKLEKFLSDKNQGGYIDYVQIRIYETVLLDGRKSGKLTFLDFKWKLP